MVLQERIELSTSPLPINLLVEKAHKIAGFLEDIKISVYDPATL
jgi:hypothetical protein